MKLSNSIFLLVGLVGTVASSATAQAGDWNNGAGPLPGMRGSSVPVPAPVPVPEYRAKWYFRGDVGLNVTSDPGASVSGRNYGQTDSPPAVTGGSGPNPFGFGGGSFNSANINTDFPTSAIWGVGVGYYWSPHLRFDATADVRSHGEVKLDGSYRYNRHARDINTGNWSPIPPTSRLDGTVEDKTIMRSGIFMANAYYDIGRYNKFRPYVGVGLGFAYNEIERKNRNRETICAPNTPGSCDQPGTPTEFSSSSKDHTVTLAAAVTTGFSYELYGGTHLDFNYRLLYTGSTHADLSVRNVNSQVKIDEMYEHQFRAGVRWDIN